MSIDSRAINSLMSPPEPTPLESFARGSEGPSKTAHTKPTYPTALDQFPSPPVSPFTTNINPSIDRTIGVQDPILFPQEPANPVPQPPLFSASEDSDVLAAQRAVDQHMRARVPAHARLRDVSPPSRTDYLLTLEFRTQVYAKCAKSPRAWLERERETLREDNAIRASRPHKRIAPYPSTPRIVAVGITKPSRGAGVKASPTKPRAAGPRPRSAVKPKVRDMSEQPKARGTTREDKDFQDLPDYCPPLDTLPNKPDSLKVEWKTGNKLHPPRDDPAYALCHEDEISLASILRLDCSTYLTSKRRIFQARVETLRIGKEFRKTDAQQACKIDVNKASKLWMAYDKVGWLNKEYFRQYL